MKIKILALVLFVTTGIVVAFYPLARTGGAIVLPPDDGGEIITGAGRTEIEVVFVLDTTGSMDGMIQAAKEKIWSIASTMASARPAPVIRMGLVAYRDRGDEYVTRVVDLSEDLDSVYAILMDFQAEGGGDAPESVNQALYEAVHAMSWSSGHETYRTVFLVGDAPPHLDYQDDVKYPKILAAAAQRGITINAIQCGSEPETQDVWRRIASLGEGAYFQVEQGGGAVAIASPFDERIAGLSAELDATRLYYGSVEDKLKHRARLDATAKLHAESSPAAQARRGAFNVLPGGAASFLGDGELVEDVTSGRTDLSKIDRTMLPDSLQSMTPSEREAVIRTRAARREELKHEIRVLAEQRRTYLQAEVEEAGGAGTSLDEKIYQAVRSQAAKKGFEYESATADY